jgi:hypothetical protein
MDATLVALFTSVITVVEIDIVLSVKVIKKYNGYKQGKMSYFQSHIFTPYLHCQNS